MPRNIVRTDKAAAPPPTYSQAVKAAGLIFVSGTAPADPATGKLVEGGAGTQTAQCLSNISAILEAAGSSLDKAVSATLVLANEDDFAAVNEEWLKWFPTAGLDRDDRRSLSVPPQALWMGSTQATPSGFSAGSISRLTTTASESERTRTQLRVSSVEALISWCGTKGGT